MWLLVIFVVVPAVELYLLVEVGSHIGIWPTIGLIVFTGVAGVTLARAEGTAVLHRLRRAVAEGRMPGAEIVDGLLILLAGVTLLTPGFLTDAIGFLVLFPLTRPLFRALALRWVSIRIHHMTRLHDIPPPSSGAGFPPDHPGAARRRRDPFQEPPIDVEVEVLDDAGAAADGADGDRARDDDPPPSGSDR